MKRLILVLFVILCTKTNLYLIAGQFLEYFKIDCKQSHSTDKSIMNIITSMLGDARITNYQ